MAKISGTISRKKALAKLLKKLVDQLDNDEIFITNDATRLTKSYRCNQVCLEIDLKIETVFKYNTLIDVCSVEDD